MLVYQRVIWIIPGYSWFIDGDSMIWNDLIWFDMIWMCLKMRYTLQMAVSIGTLMINNWSRGYLILRQTHICWNAGTEIENELNLPNLNWKCHFVCFYLIPITNEHTALPSWSLMIIFPMKLAIQDRALQVIPTILPITQMPKPPCSIEIPHIPVHHHCKV